MPMKNKYIIHSHISEKKFRDIIYLFSEDLPNTVNKYFETMFGRNDKDNDAMTFGLNIQIG